MGKNKIGQYIVVAMVVIFAVAMIAYTMNPAAFQVITQQPTTENLNLTDIGQSYHDLIDKYFPYYIQQRRVDCTAIDGTWYDDENRIGCFDIPANAWDSSNCITYQIRYLQDQCNVIGGEWICTSNDVGCFR